MAYVPPYELTKLDVAALRKADYIVCWLNSHGVVGSRFEAVKRAEKTVANPFAVDVHHEIAAPVTCVRDWSNGNGEWACVESVTFYRSQVCHAASVIGTLRAGDAIKLQFYPDAHSSPVLKEAGFHGDQFNLVVYRAGKRHAIFELRSSICQNNSARMCRPVVRQYAIAG